MGFLHTPLGMYLASWVVAGLLMWIGARISGLRHVGFGRALVASVAATVVTWTLATYLTESLGIMGLIVALCITLFVIKGIFESGWEEALMVWVINAVGQFALATFGWSHGILAHNMMPRF